MNNNNKSLELQSIRDLSISQLRHLMEVLGKNHLGMSKRKLVQAIQVLTGVYGQSR